MTVNRRTRRLAALFPLVVVPLGLGPAAVTAGAAPAAVTAGSCTVKPSDDGTTVTVTGTGFVGTRGAALRGSSGNAEGLGNLDGFNPPGFFTRSGLPPGDYLVQAQVGTVVRCKAVRADKETDKELVRAARDRGFADGVKAGKAAAQESCDNDTPRPRHHQGLTARQEAIEKAYEQGFLAGATSAFDKFC
ncbi:hypothetical protein [Streptomyces sp. WAC06614]|uniref:hypothetical protein n=1 Tax=Streptomyces sp. WAC06614 TaxID=2487416 RepID=UPI000F7A4A7E|nr:hypothetical protein [Streptomyces sp. WAC06614]RSS61227.1 hypothetical protein EF918_31970 [Streptomyces sp. WAC06614]